jgi:hypothetical protein
MALNYIFYLEAAISPEDMLLIVSDMLGIPLNRKNELYDHESHLFIHAHTTDIDDQQIIQNAFNFIPKTDLYFTHSKQNYERNNKLMLMAVVGLLKEFSGNCVLEFTQSISPVIARIDGEIIVNPDWIETPGMELFDKECTQYLVKKLYME